MVVLFEFMGDEPIENVITCMNYKVDKVVFFGYFDAIVNDKEKTVNFLNKYCGVSTATFHPLSQKDLQSALGVIRKEIEREYGHGSDLYIDITGGESLALVALGMLSKEFRIPLHTYDIAQGKLIELEGDATRRISKCVQMQEIKMDLDKFVEMRGGIINYRMQKSIKISPDEDFQQDIENIFTVMRDNTDYWNPLCDFLHTFFIPNDDLQVNSDMRTVKEALYSSRNKLNNMHILNALIDALGETGVIQDIVRDNKQYSFTYKSEEIKKCLWEGGCVLELRTYSMEAADSDDCRVGVHLDWDGVIHSLPGYDVLNEIDVLTLHGYVPTFISCKSGQMTPQQVLYALYELDTVAKRFGGKYSKKVLVSAKEIGELFVERAKEMGIEIRY